MTVQLEDTSGLLRRFGDHQNILLTELRKGEHEGLVALRDEAKRGAAAFSSLLPQSVQYEVGGDGLTGKIGSVAKTALSIHEGRKPGAPPSYEAIESWMQRKGIATGASMSVKSRRRRRFRAGSSEMRQLHDDALVIVARIRAVGTKGLPFILPAAEASKQSVTNFFSAAVDRALHRLAGR